MKIERVLLVDDDSTIRKISEISLSRVGGWKVVQAESGANALEILEDFQPDLILLDVMMPGMDGPTTFRQIRANLQLAETPVIFMTAKVQTQELLAYHQLGVAGVIVKPFDPLLLPNEILEILNSLEAVRVA